MFGFFKWLFGSVPKAEVMPLATLQLTPSTPAVPPAPATTFESLPPGMSDPLARPRPARPPSPAPAVEGAELRLRPAADIVPPEFKIDEGHAAPSGEEHFESLGSEPIVARSVITKDTRQPLVPDYEDFWYQPPSGPKQCCKVPAAPWSAICRLEITIGSGTAHGTGWFIGPRTIMTAAHNLYARTKGLAASNITIYAGAPGPDTPFLPVTTSLYEYDHRYAEASSDVDATRYDYGVIFVPDDGLGNLVRKYFKYSPQKATTDLGTIQIAGFPHDKNYELVYAKGNQTGTDPQIIIHDIDTEAGQSGAPIYHWSETTGYTVIGVHTDGFGKNGQGLSGQLGYGEKRNGGVRITPDLKKRMDFWKANPGQHYDSDAAIS